LEPVRPYPPVKVDTWTRSLAIFLMIAMVYVGIFPDQFMALTEAAARSLP
jgi:NADH-quinone oxidoreductase subunit N